MSRCQRTGCESEATKEILRLATIEEQDERTVFNSQEFSIPARFKENVCEYHYQEEVKRKPPAENDDFL